MPAPLRVSVPSPGLLRFLRLQTESFAFISPLASSVGPALFRRASRPRCAAKTSPRTVARPMTTACAEHGACLRASILDVESITARLQRKRKNAGPATMRFFSTTSARPDGYTDLPQQETLRRPTWQERLLGASAGRGSKSLKLDDLAAGEDHENNSMFNTRRTLTAKAALEPRLRCTEVDENGQVILVDGEFKKTELIAKVRTS